MKKVLLLLVAVLGVLTYACTPDTSHEETQELYGIDKDKVVPPINKGKQQEVYGIDKDKVVPPIKKGEQG
ncbi:hypothetical protein [Zhouia amylolytica]|uniref:Lipoprotein n=1 Tax=Zhouia amylolytica AD3 TaxID=1286632 RepID=W2UPB6_9FLAO|nr:hypothetical protein [Zhouia amylolytica]ETN95764.1 hypothetical protein P278_14860 [Zhouia amylolytica AD3]MCQ0112072.1 hypothetical protein [Zhouia amylolytica]